MAERTQPLPTWRQAWQDALYGPDGFFVHNRPIDHFRTSVHASPLFAEAIVALARRHDLDTIVDIGAGAGELLTHVHVLDPALELVGIEVASRPAELPPAITWYAEMPARLHGLVIANEWLDNLPCDVVEADEDGAVRVVHVDPSTGEERLGADVDDAWLHTWWPLREPGTRAEIGVTRDEAWGDVVGRLSGGMAVAIDYGHALQSRPPFGSLRSYRGGREVDVLADGSRDITAHVAMDSLHADRLLTQRDMLHCLGISGARPARSLAGTDPAGYVRELSRASAAAELTAVGGLGDFFWAISHRP
ncbi:MAG TPA: SAM-dependent methyltransferase [Nocardioidaceae bacterium]|nr:SAM-dependent methyltransferase [Nocardioidaceae bacterium]